MEELKLLYLGYQKSNETDSMKFILFLINERNSSIDTVTQSLFKGLFTFKISHPCDHRLRNGRP